MRALRVVVADGGLLPRAELLFLAERASFEVVADAVEAADVAGLFTTRAADLVLVAGSPDYVRAVLTGLPHAAALVVAPDAASAKGYVDCGAYAIVTPNQEPEVVAATASATAARAADLAAAFREAADLRRSLETRKVVERAKGILMRRLGADEAVAYRRMQKASQNENRTMRDIAESILAAERLFDEGEGGT